MKIYAIDSAVLEEELVDNKPELELLDTEEYVQDYDEWEDYVTQYKTNMIPAKDYKGMTAEAYLAYREKIDDYCESHFNQDIINQVLDLYRNFNSMREIGEKLGIKPTYISSLLKMHMSVDEFRDLKTKIKHIRARQYRSRGIGVKRIMMEKKLPELVWQSIYVNRKSFEQTAKELEISYERLNRILDIIKVSLSPQANKF